MKAFEANCSWATVYHYKLRSKDKFLLQVNLTRVSFQICALFLAIMGHVLLGEGREAWERG